MKNIDEINIRNYEAFSSLYIRGQKEIIEKINSFISTLSYNTNILSLCEICQNFSKLDEKCLHFNTEIKVKVNGCLQFKKI